MASVNLWPGNLKSVVLSEGPSVLLKEQAQLLGANTDGLVEAYVSTDVSPNPGKPSYFIDSFILLSPSLNYRYPLFSIRYSAEFYPLLIEWWGYQDHSVLEKGGNSETREGVKQIWNGEELEEELRHIFAHEDTRRIIGNLISRSFG